MPYYAAIFQILRSASYSKRLESGRAKGAPRWLISAKLNFRRFRPALPELADNASLRSPKRRAVRRKHGSPTKIGPSSGGRTEEVQKLAGEKRGKKTKEQRTLRSLLPACTLPQVLRQ